MSVENTIFKNDWYAYKLKLHNHFPRQKTAATLQYVHWVISNRNEMLVTNTPVILVAMQVVMNKPGFHVGICSPAKLNFSQRLA